MKYVDIFINDMTILLLLFLNLNIVDFFLYLNFHIMCCVLKTVMIHVFSFFNEDLCFTTFIIVYITDQRLHKICLCYHKVKDNNS